MINNRNINAFGTRATWLKGFVQRPVSAEMAEQEAQNDGLSSYEKTKETQTVYTDGGCVNMAGGTRAGYGIYWGDGDRRNESRALRGQQQTAQRA